MAEEKNNAEEKKEKKSESLYSKMALTGNDVLKNRTRTAYSNVAIQAKAALDQAKTKVYGIMSQITEHEDVAVANKLDLKPGFKDQPVEWVARGMKLALELKAAWDEYQVKKAWYNRLFPEDEPGFEEPDLDELHL